MSTGACDSDASNFSSLPPSEGELELREWLRINATRFPEAYQIRMEIATLFNKQSDTTWLVHQLDALRSSASPCWAELHAFCDYAWGIYVTVFKQKKLHLREKTDPWHEAFVIFRDTIEEDLRQRLESISTERPLHCLLSLISVEQLWKLLSEELWWALFGFLDWSAFAHIHLQEQAKFVAGAGRRSARESQHKQKDRGQAVKQLPRVADNGDASTSVESPATLAVNYYDLQFRDDNTAFRMSKQGHDFVRYLVWGYHFAYEPFFQENWLAPAYQQLHSGSLRNIVLIDLENLGSSVDMLSKRNFDFQNTIFYAFCGPDYRPGSSVNKWATFTDPEHEQHFRSSMKKQPTKKPPESASVSQAAEHSADQSSSHHKQQQGQSESHHAQLQNRKLVVVVIRPDLPNGKRNKLEEYVQPFYECGYWKKWKNVADFALSAFCGALHKCLPMNIRVWIVSRDDGLEHPAFNLRTRGRECFRITDRNMLSELDRAIHPSVVLRSMQQQCEEFDRHFISEAQALSENAYQNVQRMLSEGGFEALKAKCDALRDQSHPGYDNETLPWSHFTEKEISEKIHETTWGVVFSRQEHEQQLGEKLAEVFTQREATDITWLSLKGRRMGMGSMSHFFSRSLLQDPNSSNLRVVDVRGNRMGDEAARTLADFLRRNQSVTFLDIGASQISDKGAIHIAEALEENHTLAVLDMRWNKIAMRGSLALSKALEKNKGLTYLNLRRNLLGCEGVFSIMQVLMNNLNTTLCSIDVRENSTQDIGYHLLARPDLMSNPGSMALPRPDDTHYLRSLTSLDICSNKIKDGVEAIASFLCASRSITRLAMDYNTIGDAGCRHLSAALSSNSSLTVLSVARNGISDEGAQYLAAALKRNSTLTWLDMHKNQIADLGAVAIADVLRSNQVVANVVLQNNAVSDIGCLAIAKALESNESITALELRDNKIGREGAVALAEMLKINTTITSVNLKTNPIGDFGVAYLANCLKDHPSVQHVNLQDCDIRDTAAEALRDCVASPGSQISILDLTDNFIGDDGITALESFPKLHSFLTMPLPNNYRHRGLISMINMTSVAPYLMFLSLAGNRIGNEGVDVLAKNSLFINSPNLALLDLSENGISADGAKSLAVFLNRNSSLTGLLLKANELADDGLVALSEGLRNNCSLTHLQLEMNRIGSVGAAALADALVPKANRSSLLSILRMPGNDIGDEGAAALALAIQASPSLTYLNIERNPRISAAGANSVCAAAVSITTEPNSHLSQGTEAFQMFI